MIALSDEALKRLPDLPERLRLVMEHRHGLAGHRAKTLREVAELVAVSPQRARQLQMRAESILHGWALRDDPVPSGSEHPICPDSFYGDIIRVALYNILLREGVTTMEEAAELGLADLTAIPNIGTKCIQTLGEDLRRLGLGGGPDWPPREPRCPWCGRNVKSQRRAGRASLGGQRAAVWS